MERLNLLGTCPEMLTKPLLKTFYNKKPIPNSNTKNKVLNDICFK